MSNVTHAMILTLLDQHVTLIEKEDDIGFEADFFFPDSYIGMHISTTGSPMGYRHKGVHVKLRRMQDDGGPPKSAEVYSHDVTNISGHYVDMGLTWNNKKLIDYDGADNLPKELSTVLTYLGYDTKEVDNE